MGWVRVGGGEIFWQLCNFHDKCYNTCRIIFVNFREMLVGGRGGGRAGKGLCFWGDRNGQYKIMYLFPE